MRGGWRESVSPLTGVGTPGPRSERQAPRLATRDRDCGSRVVARRDVDIALAWTAAQQGETISTKIASFENFPLPIRAKFPKLAILNGPGHRREIMQYGGAGGRKVMGLARPSI